MRERQMREELRKLSEPSRRQFVTAAAASYLGVSVLGHGSRVWAAEPATTAKAQSVIYIYMSGGMTHLDTFDPKPGTPEQGKIAAIKTAVPGVQIGEMLPKLAGEMKDVSLIRSMNSREGSHERGTYLVHTGYPPLSGIEHASVGAWTLKLAGPRNKSIPNFVQVGGAPLGSGAGFMGAAYSPAIIGDPKSGLQNVTRPTSASDSDYAKTLSLIDELDSDFRDRFNSSKVTAYNDFYSRAVSLMSSEDIKAFDLKNESEATQQRFGMNQLGQGLLLARRLVEAGVRFIEVEFGGWDMHNNHAEALAGRLPQVDQAVATLIQDLRSRGLLASTLICVCTEFGRTPRINENNGRDHHPSAWSTLVAGGGVKGGYVHGKSDKGGYKVEADGVTPQDFNATLAYALGLKPDQIVNDEVSGRPFRMGGLGGKPVTALF